MKLRVHIFQPTDQPFLAELHTWLEDGVEVTSGTKVPDPADYRVLVSGRVEKSFVTSIPNLDTLIIPWAGLPVSTRETMLGYPEIAVHNLHYNAGSTAELALGLMLAAAKRIVVADRDLRKGDWTRRYEEKQSVALEGRQALILGYGAIGRRIGKAVDALGMQVNALRRTKRPGDPEFVQEFTYDVLQSSLATAQVVFICLPFTEESRGLLGEEELALLPNGAILINVARGGVVAESALYEACRSGRIRAGLDVWYEYPKEESDRTNTLPSRFPFHDLDNVVMTPHLGGNSDQDDKACARELARLLNARLNGQPMPNRVDVERGY